MSEKKVTVTIASGTIAVDLPSVQVKKDLDNVKWICDTNPFTIVLPGQTIDSRPEGGKFVGKSGFFSTLGKIKYDVTSGTLSLDPDVDVIPAS